MRNLFWVENYGDQYWHVFVSLYINDLDDDITSKVLKFANDTKVFWKIKKWYR